VDEFGSTGAAVSQNTGSGQFSGSFVRSVAVDDATQFSYVGDSGPDAVDVFDNTGTFVTQWDGSTTPSGSFGGGYVYAAVDNSTGPSAGDVYVTDSSHGVVDKLSGGTTAGSQPTPVDFSGSASYISGSEITGTPSGSFGNLQGIAVDSGGNIYAVDQGKEVVDEFSQAGTFLRQITGASVPGGSFGSIVAVGVNNANGNVYVVDAGENAVDEFSSSGAFLAQLTGADTRAGSFSSPQGVAVDSSGDVYVADGGNHVIDEFGADVTLTPVIDDESAANVTSGSADLRADVSNGLSDTYHFEYGTGPCSSSACTSVPAPDASIPGSVTGNQSVSQHLGGLKPGTAYHYRVVITSSLGATDGPDRVFTTQVAGGPGGPDTCPNAAVRAVQASAFLPDCRAYEMVSPVDKNGGDAGVNFGRGVQASVDGNKFAYVSATPFPGSVGTGVLNFYLASRTTNGWLSQSLLPPQATGTQLGAGAIMVGYSADLSTGLLLEGGGAGQDAPPLVSGEPSGVANLFVRDNNDGSYQLADLTPAGNPPGDAQFDAATSDFSHVLFQSPGQLTADTPPGENNVHNLYEWVGGTLRLVDQIPPAGSTQCGGSGPACVASPNGGDAGGGGFNGGARNAVSPDGSKIYFIDFGGQEDEPGQLYVRENGTTTVEVSASQKTNGSGPGGTDPNGPIFPTYQIASGDGSKVFFTSCEQLTNDSTAGSGGPGTCHRISNAAPNQGNDLYEYDTGTGQLTDLTVDPHPATDPSCSAAAGTFCGANVQGVLATSSDGSYVYFVADGVLAPGASPGTCDLFRDPGGTCNLYVSHFAGTTRTTKFIATLDIGDARDWDQTANQARLTADGTHLAFMSTRSLTGYDNTDTGTGQADTEVFLYNANATSDPLSCVSCNPTGARPAGPSSLASVEEPTPLGTYLPRNLSEDGSRLFFDSADALVPSDTDGTQDVYEWEADGSGSCQSSADNGGCLSLISGGQSTAGSSFMDANPSGSDVFFSTKQQLVSLDSDQNIDVYDARADGGIPAQNQAPPSAPCSGNTCRGPVSPAPSPPTAASISFAGPANPSAAIPSAKGKVKTLTRVVSGSTFFVKVSVPGKGRIAISGSGIKTVRRSTAKAGTYGLRVTLTASETRALKRSAKQKRKLKLRLRVVYTPDRGTSSTLTVSITDKATQRPHR